MRACDLHDFLYDVIPVDVGQHFLHLPLGVELAGDNVEDPVVAEGGLDNPTAVLVVAERDDVLREEFGYGLGEGFRGLDDLLYDVVSKNVSGEGKKVGHSVLGD